jgi:hypothetical protein
MLISEWSGAIRVGEATGATRIQSNQRPWYDRGNTTIIFITPVCPATKSTIKKLHRIKLDEGAYNMEIN